MSDELKPLNKKQQVFVDEYLKCFNGAEAARRAGYTKARARVTASELLADSNISEHIQARLAEVHMSADEALKLQADIARGDIGALADENGFFDFGKAKEKGLTKLIKKFKQKTITYLAKGDSGEDREVHETEIELYPADVAQERILKVGGKLKDNNININVSLTDD